MRGPAGGFCFDPALVAHSAHFPPLDQPPHPYCPAAACPCYACAWRALAVRNPYRGFPDLHAPPFVPDDSKFGLRCSPGFMLGHSSRFSAASSTVSPDPHAWHNDLPKRRRALRRYLSDPYPPTHLEHLVHVRPVQYVCTNREIRPTESVERLPDGSWKTNPPVPYNHYDPLLVDGLMTTDEGADQDPNVDLLCTQDFIDFDLIDAQGTEFPFRMQLNMGDLDQNTGWFATIRNRLTAEFVGNAMSVNGGMTLVSCFDNDLLDRFVEHSDLPPVCLLIPYIKDPEFLQGARWAPDDVNDDGEDICSLFEPDAELDPYRRCIQTLSGVQSSGAHQVEMLFAMAAKIDQDSFTIFNLPDTVAVEFKFRQDRCWQPSAAS
ncbi:hypothetical protein HDU88_007888 [Geranomyces variabilis]|nr:hypothetical protein HDU88_007888 [Geranomyces variabilis]